MSALNIDKNEGFQINCIAKGFLCSLIITILLSLIISLFLQFTSLSESLLPVFAIFIFLISVFLGAVISARAAGCLGLFHGLTVAVLYWLLLLLITQIGGLGAFTFLAVLKRLALTLGAGLLGGIIGIGLTEK